MKQIKIRNKNYNCSNAIYYHILGLESENRLFNMEIKGHEQSEFELSKRIDKAIEYIETIIKNTPSSTRKDYANMILIDYKKVLEILNKGSEKEC